MKLCVETGAPPDGANTVAAKAELWEFCDCQERR